MRNILRNLYLYILGVMQARCEHPAEFVCADILEGDVNGLSIQWCKVCGAFRLLRPVPAGSILQSSFLGAFANAGGILGGAIGAPRWNLAPSEPLSITLTLPVGEWRTPEPRWMSDRIEAEGEQEAA